MAKPLRVGVLGLGARWRKRYQPALLALRDRFALVALCDQVQQRAAVEAKQLRCRAALGPTDLVTGAAIDAVLLLDNQWFGLWPLELACRLGKPVFCAASLERDDAHADALRRQVQDSRLPVMAEMAPRFTPATVQLRELLDTRLGPARLVLCDVLRPARKRPAAGPQAARSPVAELLGGGGVALLDWCASFFKGEPVRVHTTGVADLVTILLEFGGGQALQIVSRRAPAVRRAVRLEVVAERGPAAVEQPNRVCWTGTDGQHVHTLPRTRPLGQVLLKRFHEMVQGRRPTGRDWENAYRALGWLRAAARSRAKVQSVTLPLELG